MSGLRLQLTAPATVPLDEVLVAIVSLTNDGDAPVTTTSRLSLVEGDVDVVVEGPAGTSRAGWPWPVDSGQRQVELAPGATIEGGLLLLTAAGERPLFPEAGRYDLVAELLTVGVRLASEPVTVVRTAPVDDEGRARAALLQDRSVARSFASASVLEGASLDAFRDGAPVARLLASLATTDRSEVDEAVAGGLDPAMAAATLTSVLPAGLSVGDERFVLALPAIEAVADERARAMLQGVPVGDR